MTATKVSNFQNIQYVLDESGLWLNMGDLIHAFGLISGNFRGLDKDSQTRTITGSLYRFASASALPMLPGLGKVKSQLMHLIESIKAINN